ncbi:hypothetical protein ACLOJK_016563 [Asimina triloba]
MGRPMLTMTNESNPWWPVFKQAIIASGGKLAKPEILASTTDARFMRQRGIPTLGFSPMTNTPILLHDNDETSSFTPQSTPTEVCCTRPTSAGSIITRPRKSVVFCRSSWQSALLDLMCCLIAPLKFLYLFSGMAHGLALSLLLAFVCLNINFPTTRAPRVVFALGIWPIQGTSHVPRELHFRGMELTFQPSAWPWTCVSITSMIDQFLPLLAVAVNPCSLFEKCAQLPKEDNQTRNQ